MLLEGGDPRGELRGQFEILRIGRWGDGGRGGEWRHGRGGWVKELLVCGGEIGGEAGRDPGFDAPLCSNLGIQTWWEGRVAGVE